MAVWQVRPLKRARDRTARVEREPGFEPSQSGSWDPCS